MLGLLFLGSDQSIKEGQSVKRTGKIIEVGVGSQLLGRVVNPYRCLIDGLGEIKTEETRPIEKSST